MRVAEWIQFTFVSLVTVAAWIRPVNLARERQLKVAALAAGAITTILAVRFTIPFFSTPASSVVRDWLPAALLLVPYWQIGQFFRSPNQNLQERLAALDRFLFAIQHPARKRLGTALALYLELAYLIAYPLIPLGLAVLYSAGLRRHADQYWAAVLLATYVCLAVTPFVQALPPRMLADYITFDIPHTKIRALNQWILRRSSIQAITFPSAHVAASMAASLVLLAFVPWVGLVFTWLAVSIAVAAVVGGYHYAADVLAALLIVVLVFLGLHWLW